MVDSLYSSGPLQLNDFVSACIVWDFKKEEDKTEEVKNISIQTLKALISQCKTRFFTIGCFIRTSVSNPCVIILLR